MLALLAGAQSVPPPVEQVQADCRAPTYATDMLVCGDYDLRSRDAEMGALTGRVGRTALDGLEPFIEPQAAWFRRRSRCAFETDHRQCAADAYEERTVVLLMLLEPDDVEAPSYSCRGPAGLKAVILRNRALVLTASEKRVGVAMQRFEHSEWRPYALLEGTIDEPSVHVVGSPLIPCISSSNRRAPSSDE